VLVLQVSKNSLWWRAKGCHFIHPECGCTTIPHMALESSWWGADVAWNEMYIGAGGPHMTNGLTRFTDNLGWVRHIFEKRNRTNKWEWFNTCREASYAQVVSVASWATLRGREQIRTEPIIPVPRAVLFGKYSSQLSKRQDSGEVPGDERGGPVGSWLASSHCSITAENPIW